MTFVAANVQHFLANRICQVQFKLNYLSQSRQM